LADGHKRRRTAHISSVKRPRLKGRVKALERSPVQVVANRPDIRVAFPATLAKERTKCVFSPE
jgi:hypothetical protein